VHDVFFALANKNPFIAQRAQRHMQHVLRGVAVGLLLLPAFRMFGQHGSVHDTEPLVFRVLQGHFFFFV
jgi:hypothetical protein